MDLTRFQHPSLRVRILAPAVLVAVPALALLVYMSIDRRLQAERTINQNAAQVARLAAVDQERLIDGTRQLLIAMSQSLDVREGNIEGCSNYLHQLLPQYGSTYANLGFADLNGEVQCSGMGEPISVADRAYFIGAVASRGFAVGDYAIGRQTGRATLSFAYPVAAVDGALRGIVYASVDLKRLNETLGVGDWPAGATLIVTDRHGTIIVKRPDWQSALGQSLASDPVTSAIGARTKGTIDREDDGQRELYAFERITTPIDTGLTVRVLIPKAQAMAAADRAMYEGLATLGLVSFLVLMGAKAAAEQLLLSPLRQLTNASRRLAAGDLGARAASSTTIPELKELGQDFDDMAASLEEREAARLRAELDRKELEQQYHQAQKMDAVGRLAGGIAHDFNNMLTAIIGYCELLIEDPAITDAQRSDVQEIEKAGRTAAALTRQLLAFSRREIIEPVVLDMNSVLVSMDKMLQRLLGDNIRVESRLSHSLSCVTADRGQIEQVILNLFVNARDAMPQGGRILVETTNLLMSEGIASRYLAAPAGRYVVLTVTDDGSGIPDDVLSHLFEPFFTTKGTGKGTGLGLATIYGIAKQAGGAIRVESRMGKGTAFQIYMPQSFETPSETAGPIITERAPIVRATILVVEDDPGIRDLASRVLARYGYDVLVAPGGEEARALSNQHAGAIDLLLSDVVMPGMSGPKVAEMLTDLRPSLKVLYMSGYTDDAIVRHGVMARDVPFLQKPFTPERLASKILEVLGSA